jgi:hypothetical protein
MNDPLPWIWLRATGVHDRLELTGQERITFEAIANRNEDVW